MRGSGQRLRLSSSTNLQPPSQTCRPGGKREAVNAKDRPPLSFPPLSRISARSLEGGPTRIPSVHASSMGDANGTIAAPVLPPGPAPPPAWKGNMALYEHVVIARQDISAQQAEALNDQLKALIEEGGGSVAKIEYWGLRNLTYRVKKNRKGHYSLLAIDAPSAAVKEMERQLSINEDVLRYMTVRVEELDLELSPILARKERERERERERTPGPRGGYEDLV